MTRRLLCHVDSTLRETGNASPGAELRYAARQPPHSSLFASPTSRDRLPTCSPSSLRVAPHRVHALTPAGRLLSPTEAVHEGRRAMAPPNVTVVQGGLGPFASHPPPPPPPTFPGSRSRRRPISRRPGSSRRRQRRPDFTSARPR